MNAKALLGVSAMVLAALTAQAVEDGQGTNVVRNLRVNDGGTIMLAGTAITNWALLPTATGGVSRIEYIAWSNTVQGATNALQSQAAALQGATGILNTATNALQIQATALQGATNVLNSATNALQIQATALQGATNALQIQAAALQGATNALQIQATALQGATGVLNSATNALQINKLDRVGGTATTFTVTGTLYLDQGTNQSFATSGALINPFYGPYIVITGTTANVSVSIAGGPTPLPDNAGLMITLQGGAGNAVTLTNGGIVALENGVNFTFNTNSTMQLIWSGSGKWTELNRVAQPQALNVVAS